MQYCIILASGTPILSQNKSNNLTNVIIAVARYFGGKKFGASGLITAYKTVAAAALTNAIIIKKTEQVNYELPFGFDVMGKLLSNLKKEPIEITETTMTDNCNVRIAINKDIADAIIEKYKNEFTSIIFF